LVSKEATEQTAPAADSGLSDYEMVVLINPELADENFEAAVNNISRFITERGGSITSIDKWGKKKLSYPIKRFKEASYIMEQGTGSDSAHYGECFTAPAAEARELRELILL
jgi:ribosomal protein S6